MVARLLLIVSVRAVLSVLLAQAALSSDYVCPCEEQSLCEPVDRNVAEKEIFGFVVGSEQDMLKLPLDRITTIAWSSSSTELMCKAHKAKVKLIAGDGVYKPTPITGNKTERLIWAEETLKYIQKYHMDGITFDWEEPAAVGSDKANWYAELIELTSQIFHRANKNYQISVCAAWSPDVIDGRGYDYERMAKAADLLYVMDYDTRSQIYYQCIAGANAPYPGTIHGVQRYLDIGVPPSKLVLGVPWYGYRYPCINGTSTSAHFCPIESVSFRGVNCSDAAGSEHTYSELLETYKNYATTKVRWGENAAAPYFNTLEDGQVVQYWFDNPESLRKKYAYAKSVNLRGVGPYTFSYAVDQPEMWTAFESFLDDNIDELSTKLK